MDNMSEALHHHDDLDDALDIASHANDETQAERDAAFEASRRRAALRVVGPAERTPAAPLRPEETRANRQSSTDEDRELRKKALLFGAGAAGVATVAAIAVPGMIESAQRGTPEFSQETTTYSLGEGEGIWNAARHVEGWEDVETVQIVDHIKADPANIDVLSDGLQVGESLVIPKSVKQ